MVGASKLFVGIAAVATGADAAATQCMVKDLSTGACSSMSCGGSANIANLAQLYASSSPPTYDACGVLTMGVNGAVTGTVTGCMPSNDDSTIAAAGLSICGGQVSGMSMICQLKKCTTDDCNTGCEAPSDATDVLSLGTIGGSSGVRNVAAVGVVTAVLAAFLA